MPSKPKPGEPVSKAHGGKGLPRDGVVVPLRGTPRKVRIKVHATVEVYVIWDKKKRPSAVITGFEFDGFGDGSAKP